MINDSLNLFSENQKRCYEYLKSLRKLMKGKWSDYHYRYRIPVFQGMAMKTREIEDGVYNIKWWFIMGHTNVTWDNYYFTSSIVY